MKKILACVLVMVLMFTGCSLVNEQKIEGTQIKLSDKKITVDGKTVTNDTTQAVYTANDIVFYLEGQDFKYGEASTTFIIVKGENQFANVSPVATTVTE